ncbi:hypothetical protein J2792_004158 [Novosphingobium capsulatum]|uniref:Uncharacterized protein n=1 Tax=Novosphingobium capsulatum TaxID=13688 RepID=A0ABU1MSD4_9SPHN|nr:hypothetical protein [Novosphingobium capsulatum]
MRGTFTNGVAGSTLLARKPPRGLLMAQQGAVPALRRSSGWPHQSSHYSQTLPIMSYRPYPFAGKLRTGLVRTHSIMKVPPGMVTIQGSGVHAVVFKAVPMR